jgi:hypothetical protein
MYSQEALAFHLLLPNIHLSSLEHERLQLPVAKRSQYQDGKLDTLWQDFYVLHAKFSVPVKEMLLSICCSKYFSNVTLQCHLKRPPHKFTQTLMILTFIGNEFVPDPEYIDRVTFLVSFSYSQNISGWYFKVTKIAFFAFFPIHCLLSLTIGHYVLWASKSVVKWTTNKL